MSNEPLFVYAQLNAKLMPLSTAGSTLIFTMSSEEFPSL